MQLADYHEIGQYLKESRESLSLTLEQAGYALNIRPAYLQAIEANAFEKLPSPAYVKGYIKNYANYLGADETAVIIALETYFATKKQTFFIPSATVSSKNPSRLLLVSCTFILFLLYAGWLVQDAREEKATHVIPDFPVTPAPMSAAWEGCLKSEDALCFLQLRNREKTLVPSSTATTDSYTH